jgi:hypothetical protein
MPEKMKIEVGFNKIARADDLELIGRLLFPNSQVHRFIFLVIFVELKWAAIRPVSSLTPILQKYGIGSRSFEKVRSRLRIAGIIEHVSRSSAKFGYREGWVLSSKFSNSLKKLADTYDLMRERVGERQEEKDRFVLKLCRNSES